MSTTFTTGRRAEAAAADYLRGLGYEVLAQNWRTKLCEIDIIARQADIVYCVEVKYRRDSSQGAGLDYITPAKLRQMRLAAGIWAAESGWSGEMSLAGIEVSGSEFAVTEFIEAIY